MSIKKILKIDLVTGFFKIYFVYTYIYNLRQAILKKNNKNSMIYIIYFKYGVDYIFQTLIFKIFLLNIDRINILNNYLIFIIPNYNVNSNIYLMAK